MDARETVTFAAWKLGLLQGDGPGHAGRVEVADIGVEVPEAGVALVEDDDAAGLPRRPAVTHKWATAVLVVAGSPGMEGAAVFSAAGASHAGAGMVRLGVPGTAGPHPPTGPWPLEAVRLALPAGGWAAAALEAATRCRALVIGPGLGRSEETAEQVRRVVAESPVPVVADADALFALGDAGAVHKLLAASTGQPVVLTPHDGEYARLAGGPPGPDRVAAARALAERSGAVVLLKGSLTAVAAPGGDEPSVLLSAAGSSRLATAGSGDVLSGVIGAFVARGLALPRAAALAAHVHGRAAGLGPAEGLVAGDLPALVSRWLSGARDGHG
jgi:NAD(P)H-hydrate epimerase